MNKKITIYDLLGLIKDGKAPYSILFKNEEWFWGYDTYTTYECLYKTPDAQISLFNKYRIDYCLNDKVEIIDNEEDKPIIEKIGSNANNTLFIMECYTGIPEQAQDWNFKVLENKINELTDAVNELKKEE